MAETRRTRKVVNACYPTGFHATDLCKSIITDTRFMLLLHVSVIHKFRLTKHTTRHTARTGDKAMNSILKRMRRWRDETVSASQLARLNNRMLDDIGIARSDIKRIVRHLQ